MGEERKKERYEKKKIRTKIIVIFIWQTNLKQTYNALLDVESVARHSWSPSPSVIFLRTVNKAGIGLAWSRVLIYDQSRATASVQSNKRSQGSMNLAWVELKGVHWVWGIIKVWAIISFDEIDLFDLLSQLFRWKRKQPVKKTAHWVPLCQTFFDRIRDIR